MKTINKIIHLKDHQDSLVNFIKDLLKKAENGEITMLMTASDDAKNENVVMTGYYNCDFFQRQLFVKSQELDLAYKMVEANVDNLIEIINE